MVFSKLTDDLSIISKLGDNPGADDGLTAEGLKSKFDEAALIIQAYLNGTLVETLNQLFAGGASAPNSGLNMTGPINMNNNPLQNVRDPQSAHEAMNLAFANGAYVPKSRKINEKPLSSDISLSAKDVGARGDTWLPTPAEIGAASDGELKQHAENKENPHSVTAAQVGATTMTLLWENASPTSNFASQTISMDLSEYDAIMLLTRRSTTVHDIGFGISVFGHRGFAQNLALYTEVSAGVLICGREFTPSASGIVINGGVYKFSNIAMTACNFDDSYAIPYRIYGIKMGGGSSAGVLPSAEGVGF